MSNVPGTIRHSVPSLRANVARVWTPGPESSSPRSELEGSPGTVNEPPAPVVTVAPANRTVIPATPCFAARRTADVVTCAPGDDELPPGQRWSTWDDIGVSAGPEPWPDWLITADAAIDTDLGILKTGKEADVVLLERATDESSVIMAAKRLGLSDGKRIIAESGALSADIGYR